MSKDIFNVLTLDGGGSKGVYSIGFLVELEKKLNKKLFEHFDLVYGTSTGAIIASLIGLGYSTMDIKDLYFSIIPKIMKKKTRKGRTNELQKSASEIFSNMKFEAFLTNIGIVSTHIDYARPMIFKNNIQQAFGRKQSFEPGFGSLISEAVVASCSAFPYFSKSKVLTSNQGNPELLDGGFVANNPTLFALADALKSFEIPPDKVRLFSVGVGNYREPSRTIIHESVLNLWPFWLIRKCLDANTNTHEIIRSIFFNDVSCLRINETFAEKDYETDLLESDSVKLEKLFQLGRESFAKLETKIDILIS